MAQRVLTLGGKLGGIEGQLCLAPLPYDYGDLLAGDQAIAESWIFKTAGAGETGDETLYPLGLTLDGLMELYWRAKKLEINYSFTGVDGFGDPVSDSDTITLKRARPTGFPASAFLNEYDLTVPSEWVYDTRSNGVLAATVQIFFGDAANDVVKVDGATYYPYLFFSIPTNTATFPRIGTQPAGAPAGYSETASLNGSNFAVVVDGTTAPMEDLQAFTMTVDITEWWPHAKLDGTPQWNTSTGAML